MLGRKSLLNSYAVKEAAAATPREVCEEGPGCAKIRGWQNRQVAFWNIGAAKEMLRCQEFINCSFCRKSSIVALSGQYCEYYRLWHHLLIVTWQLKYAERKEG